MNPDPTFKHVKRYQRRFALLLSILLPVLFLGFSHPFLASTHTVKARYLVVEGWLPDYALDLAEKEFRRGGYERLFTIGGPIWSYQTRASGGDFATAAAGALKIRGLLNTQVTAVPAGPTRRNRTYQSCVAFRDFITSNTIKVDSVNLVSLGVHSRRSRLCLQRALGRKVKVGVFAVKNLDYDACCWWKFSEGVKDVCGETIAFIYAWLFIDYGN